MNTENSSFYYNLAYDSIKNKRYDDAIQQLTLALGEDPSFAESYFARGVCYHITNQKDLAIKDMTQASQRGLDKALQYLESLHLSQIDARRWVDTVNSETRTAEKNMIEILTESFLNI